MTSRLVLALPCALLLAACAQLQVDVDIYRGALPTPAATVESVSQAAVAAANPAAVEDVRQRIFDDAQQAVAKGMRAAKVPNVDQAIALNWYGRSESPGSGLQARLTEAWQPVAAAASVVYGAAQQSLSSPPAGRSLGALRGAQVALDRAWQSFRGQVEKALQVQLALYPAAVPDLLRLQTSLAENPFDVPGIAASDTVTGRYAGSPIFDARVASLGQDTSDWVRFGSNEFSAGGGSSQFVVVREGLVVYHQKSLDFDPTPVIGAGAAVTKLGLKVGAALATGVVPPLPSATPATTPPTAAAAQGAFDADAAERDREALARNRRARELLLGSLAALLDQSAQANASADALKKQLKSDVNFFLGRTAKETAP